MSEYLSGPEQHITDFKRLLRRIYRKGFGIAGSVGRLALFADAGIETPPLAVSWRKNYAKSPIYFRDVDITTVKSDDDLETIIWLGERTRHFLDCSLSDYFDIPGGSLVYERWSGQRTIETPPVNPAAFELRDRNLEGVRVKTFPYGTTYEIAKWGARNPLNPEKYAHVVESLTPFMERMRTERPDEFLPPEDYAPFRQYLTDIELH